MKEVPFYRYILFSFFFFPYVGIVNFTNLQNWEHLGVISTIRHGLIVINLLIAMAIVLDALHRNKYIIPKVLFLCCAPYLYLLLRTAILLPEISIKTLTNLCVFIVLLPFFDLFILKKKERFVCMIDVLNGYTFLNSISVLCLIGQGGLSMRNPNTGIVAASNYLLGYDNGFIVLYLPLLVYNLILFHYDKRKRYIVMIVIQILTEIMVRSVMSMVCLAVFGLFLLISRRKEFAKILFRPCWVLTIYALLEFFLIFARIFDVVNPILYRFFGKNIESARLKLWTEGIETAKTHFLFGQGYTVHQYKGYYSTPHNMLLEWFGHGGIIFVVLCSIVAVTVLIRLYKKLAGFEASAIYCGIIAIAVAYYAEGYGTYITYWLVLSLFLIGFDIDKFHAILREDREEEHRNTILN